MILVTGASGKTGKMIVNKLSKMGLSVRAIVRTETQVDGLFKLGAAEVVIAELRDLK
ncbi:MAG: NAD(P)H-binding protein, partial [Anaerolineaceae bacterium]|nr:NAD(P)H-binding protein [Anaerolineaceae bacterium]